MATHRKLAETSVRSSGRRDIQPLQATARGIVRVENPGSREPADGLLGIAGHAVCPEVGSSPGSGSVRDGSTRKGLSRRRWWCPS